MTGELKFAGGHRSRESGGEAGLQRTFRRILFASFGLHLIVFLIASIGPLIDSKPKPPEFYKVKLVAGRPGGRSPARSTPASSARPAQPAPAKKAASQPPAETKTTPPPTKTAKAAPAVAEQTAKKAAPAEAAAKKAADPVPAPTAAAEADNAGEDDILSALGTARQQVGSTGGDRGTGGGSGGGTGSGDGATARDLYHARIWSRIKRAWSLPEGLASTGIDLSAIVVIRIGRDGRLIDKYIETGSGNRNFDESALRAVARSTPFPAFPGEVQDREMEIGLRFRSSEY